MATSDVPTAGGVSRWLRAGPFSVLLDDGDLRALSIGEREVIRRIAVVVRGPQWQTIPTTRSNLVVEGDGDSFRVEYDALSHQGDLSFGYHATLVGDTSGAISFGFEGQALSTFFKNRIGLVVLHPVEGCAGQPYREVTVDGLSVEGVFPDLIAPHQPVRDLGSIAHQVGDGVWANVVFSGDTFEMEDQRNWTDASFKTYSGPLERPYPVEVQAGTRIAQSVRVELQGMPSNVEPASSAVTVEIGTAPARPFPRVGLGLGSRAQTLSPMQRDLLRRLRLAHLRVELKLADGAWVATLRRAVDEAAALDTQLELAVFVDAALPHAELRALAAQLRQLQAPVSHLLILRADGHTTDAGLMSEASQCLAGIRLGGGTSANFTELNRERPPEGALACVCYSLNPQVHADDNRSMVENLAGQTETVRSARAMIGATSLVVSPVTLRPRSAVDPRQTTLFCAAWTLGSLKHLAEGGVDSVTYYETAGPGGVLPDTPDGPVFPVYHVLADVAESAAVIPSRSSRPLAVEVLAVATGSTTRVLLANVSGYPTRVVVRGLGPTATRRDVDEASVERATQDPVSYRLAASQPVSVVDAATELDLGPYAVVRIDTSAA